MSDNQLLHLLIGGELEEVSGTTFRDLSKVDLELDAFARNRCKR